MKTCQYCRATNMDDEHRCQRCGRRLEGTAGGTASEANPIRVQGALATAPAPVRQFPAPERAPVERGPAQRALFNVREPRKVIPFESAAGARSRAAAPRTAPRRAPTPRAPDTQQELDFLPPAPPAARKLKTTVEAVIYCDAPVAAKMHRALAAALDASMVLIAFGLFLVSFHWLGGEIVLDTTGISVLGGAFAAVAFFYHLLWLVARCDPPGRRWMALRLTNFDGFPPDASQRVARFVGACLSLASLGIGVLWAVVDEESLTWHDHISKTFLTVRDRPSNFVRQR